jgi:hypothetical protein
MSAIDDHFLVTIFPNTHPQVVFQKIHFFLNEASVPRPRELQSRSAEAGGFVVSTLS